jgi:hypothetical protein
VRGKAMRNLLFAVTAMATLGVATASFAGGPPGGTGTPDSVVMAAGSSGSVGMSGSSGDAMSYSRSASADDEIWGATVLPPSGGKGGYPARQSNGCPSLGDPQSTGGSRGLSC